MDTPQVRRPRVRRLAAALSLALVSSIGLAGHTVGAPVAGRSVVRVPVAGRSGVGAGASAVSVSVAAVRPSADGFATVFPCGGSVPTASTVNFRAGVTTTGSALVGVGEGGAVCVMSNVSSELVVDVTGWFPSGSSFVALTPARFLDTRGDAALVAGRSVVRVPVAGRSGVGAGASAVSVSVAAVRPSADGFATVFPCGGSVPTASTVNFRAGVTTTGSALVGVGEGGAVCVMSNVSSELVVDVTGWFPSGSSFVALTPARFLDTRGDAALVAGRSVVRVPVAGRSGVGAGASAVSVSVAAVRPSADGFATVFPCGGSVPTASTVNFRAGVTTTGSALVGVGEGGAVCVMSNVSSELVVDVTGWFPSGSSFVALTPARFLDTRSVGPDDFVEDFSGNSGLERFETGVYHRDEYMVATREWTGDHDLSCGSPVTQRTIRRDRPSESFYLCRDHLMTSVGDTSGYSIAWFAPRQTFRAGETTQVSFDVNVTDLGNRQWWEVSLVPVGSPFLATVDFAAVAAEIPTYDDRSVVVGKGPYGNDGNIVTQGVQRDPLGYEHVCGAFAVDPEGCASKAIRRTFTITDNRNGTITFDYLGRRYTYPGSFPDRFEVYFKDHNYMPDKDGVPVGHTWHWDNIVIR